MKPLFPIFACILLSTPCLSEEAGRIRQVLNWNENGNPGDTLVWTGSMQMAWDGLANHVGVENIELKAPETNESIPDAQWMDKFEWKADVTMPEEAKAWAGDTTKEFFDSVNDELVKIFPEGNRLIRLPKNVQPGSVTSIAALNRSISFSQKFHRSLRAGLKFTGSDGRSQEVHFFGTRHRWNQQFRQSVQVRWYQDPSHFAVELAGADDEDFICIFRWEEAKTLAQAIERWKTVGTEKYQGNPNLSFSDVMKIPCVRFDSEVDFSSLIGGVFHDGKNMRTVTQAKQWINFGMDESGAHLKTLARLDAPFGGPPPRKFVCDEPFYILLWKKDSENPYAAMRIDGGDWPVPWETTKAFGQ